MSNVFHIGCLHLGHSKCAEFRGFPSSEEHDENLIERWNSVVNKRAKVFIHGDISMENSRHYHLLDRLLGDKHVILGNHDRPQDVAKLLEHVDRVSGPIKYNGFWLTHIPVHPSEFEYRGLIGNIHAHIHDRKLDVNDQYFNVDAQEVNYFPMPFKTIEEFFKLKQTSKCQ